MIAILSVFKQSLKRIHSRICAYRTIHTEYSQYKLNTPHYLPKNIIYFRGETVAVVASRNKYTFIVYINILKLIITIHNRRNYDYKIHIIELNRGPLKCMNIILRNIIAICNDHYLCLVEFIYPLFDEYLRNKYFVYEKYSY